MQQAYHSGYGFGVPSPNSSPRDKRLGRDGTTLDTVLSGGGGDFRLGSPAYSTSIFGNQPTTIGRHGAAPEASPL